MPNSPTTSPSKKKNGPLAAVKAVANKAKAKALLAANRKKELKKLEAKARKAIDAYTKQAKMNLKGSMAVIEEWKKVAKRVKKIDSWSTFCLKVGIASAATAAGLGLVKYASGILAAGETVATTTATGTCIEMGMTGGGILLPTEVAITTTAEAAPFLSQLATGLTSVTSLSYSKAATIVAGSIKGLLLTGGTFTLNYLKGEFNKIGAATLTKSTDPEFVSLLALVKADAAKAATYILLEKAAKALIDAARQVSAQAAQNAQRAAAKIDYTEEVSAWTEHVAIRWSPRAVLKQAYMGLASGGANELIWGRALTGLVGLRIALNAV